MDSSGDSASADSYSGSIKLIVSGRKSEAITTRCPPRLPRRGMLFMRASGRNCDVDGGSRATAATTGEGKTVLTKSQDRRLKLDALNEREKL